MISVLNSSVVNYKSDYNRYFALVVGVGVDEEEEGRGGRGRAAERVV